MDVLFRIGHLQEQKLRDDDVGNHIIHRRAEKKDAVNQQPRINIPTALTAARLLNHDRNQKIFCVVHGNYYYSIFKLSKVSIRGLCDKNSIMLDKFDSPACYSPTR